MVLNTKKKKGLDKSDVTLIMLIVIFFGIMISGIISKEISHQPRITFVDDYIGIIENENNTFNVYGQWQSNKNMISISLGVEKDMLHAVLHEYGHYLYDKCLNNEDRQAWKTMCMHKAHLLDDAYSPAYGTHEQRCKEWFADKTSTIMQNWQNRTQHAWYPLIEKCVMKN